jgi:hypothetical protein
MHPTPPPKKHLNNSWDSMLSTSTRPKCYPPKFRNWPNFSPRMTSACLYLQVHDFLIRCLLLLVLQWRILFAWILIKFKHWWHLMLVILRQTYPTLYPRWPMLTPSSPISSWLSYCRTFWLQQNHGAYIAWFLVVTDVETIKDYVTTCNICFMFQGLSALSIRAIGCFRATGGWLALCIICSNMQSWFWKCSKRMMIWIFFVMKYFFIAT